MNSWADSRFCRCAAAAGSASSGWTSSCLCSACSETRRGSPWGSGRSSPPAAPSSARPASGWRYSRSATCGAASRSAPSGPASSSPTACGRGSGDEEDAGPKPRLQVGGRKMLTCSIRNADKYTKMNAYPTWRLTSLIHFKTLICSVSSVCENIRL